MLYANEKQVIEAFAKVLINAGLLEAVKSYSGYQNYNDFVDNIAEFCRRKNFSSYDVDSKMSVYIAGIKELSYNGFAESLYTTLYKNL